MPSEPAYLSFLNVDGVNRQLRDRLAVSTEASQGLTDEQKANARANIGAGTANYGTITSNEIIAGTDTSQKVVRADYLNTAVNSLIDTKIDAAITQALSASY